MIDQRKSIKHGKIKSLKSAFLVLAFLCSFSSALLQNPQKAHADCSCCSCCSAVTALHADLQAHVIQNHLDTQQHFGTSAVYGLGGIGELGEHERWLVNTLFKEYILPAMMQMTEQMSAVAMQQMMAIGTFFDAKQQLEIQRLLQEKETEAHKDYSPDIELCSIGTNIRSLAATEQHGDISFAVLNEHSLKRQLRNANTNASEGTKEDREGRIEQFKRIFCDRNDNNRLASTPGTGFESVCPGASNPPDRVNADIDYTRALEIPLTIDLDLTNTPVQLDDEEENILALHDYLYAHHISSQPTISDLKNVTNQDEYLDLRSVIAKRSVAEASFNAITAMKTQSAGEASDTMQYMASLLVELGLDPDEITEIYGENPSYLAQMEILAKNIYQRPEFYTSLYDKPANVTRKAVAMDAINSMIERDIFESRLRSENILSILLETEVMGNQEDVQNALKLMTSR